ncbi:hypothetical protein EAE96_008304 [Botrytis aclada]|nr:hypothetical protein EAE96_008304 [Botrytis aclada]
MNVTKKLTFRTTTAGDEAVESSESLNPIDSAVTINSTFANRDAKTVNQIQLQEDTKIPELSHVQSTKLCRGVFDQAAIANRDTTEEEMELDQLAMSDRNCKLDWEYARMNEDEQHEFLDSICGYWENSIETTQPQAFLRKFNCFPKLPFETRRRIWFYALPEPCLVELNLYSGSDYVPFFGGSELVFAEIWRTMKIWRRIQRSGAGYLIPSQLLLVCRESYDFFLEHYSIMDLQSLPGNESLSDGTTNPRQSTFHASSRGYIDNKSDTLVIRDLQCVIQRLRWFNMHLNLSVITRLSIHTDEVSYFVDHNNRQGLLRGLPSDLWKHIETLFPHLKQLTLIENTCRNSRSANQGELDFHPLSINCLQPINADTINFVLESVEKIHHHENHDNLLRRLSFEGQLALKHSMGYKSQYLERVQDNPDYWGGIEFETSLLINLQPDYDFYMINRNSSNQKDLEGDSRVLITRAESRSGTMSLYFEGWMDGLPVHNDEVFFNGSSGKEQHEGYESAKRHDYDKWPWNDPRTIHDM